MADSRACLVICVFFLAGTCFVIQLLKFSMKVLLCRNLLLFPSIYPVTVRFLTSIFSYCVPKIQVVSFLLSSLALFLLRPSAEVFHSYDSLPMAFFLSITSSPSQMLYSSHKRRRRVGWGLGAAALPTLEKFAKSAKVGWKIGLKSGKIFVNNGSFMGQHP